MNFLNRYKNIKQTKVSLKGVLSLYLLMIATLVPIFVVIGRLKSNGVIPEFTHAGIKNLHNEKDFYAIVFTFLSMSLIAPVLEEFAFRLLLKWSKVNFIVASTIFSSVFLVDVLNRLESNLFIILPSRFMYFSFLLNSIIWSLFFLPLFYLLAQRLNHRKIKTLWKNNFWFLLLISSFVFSLMHINSITIGLSFWLITLLILPNFISGIYLAFARMKYGVFGAVVLHSFSNSIIGLLVLAKQSLLA